MASTRGGLGSFLEGVWDGSPFTACGLDGVIDHFRGGAGINVPGVGLVSFHGVSSLLYKKENWKKPEINILTLKRKKFGKENIFVAS